MRIDHVIAAGERLKEKWFHLSCGFYETTSFLFQELGFVADIHCKGQLRIYTPEGKLLDTIPAKPMTSGRGCYMDVSVTNTDTGVLFRLPEYDWTDHYPHCDGESDRWTTVITGIRDEIRYPAEP